MSIGTSGLDTIFVSVIGLMGFIFGAAAMQDLERYRALTDKEIFKRLEALEIAVSIALEYFEAREDVEDGDYGHPEANEEMVLACLMRSALEDKGRKQ